MARDLVAVALGFADLSPLRSALRSHGYDVRRVQLPSGAERFVVFSMRTGCVFDSFTFYDDVSAEIVGLARGGS